MEMIGETDEMIKLLDRVHAKTPVHTVMKQDGSMEVTIGFGKDIVSLCFGMSGWTATNQAPMAMLLNRLAL